MTGASEETPAGWLFRLGRASATRPGRVVAVWVLAAVALLGASKAVGGTFVDNVVLSGTQSFTGAQLLARHDPASSGVTGLVVFHATRGTLRSDASAVSAVTAALGRLPHVLAATDPLATDPPTVSADGTIAYSRVQFSVNPKTLGPSYLARLDAAVAPLAAVHVTTDFGGGLDALTRPRASDLRSELIGVAVALVVLLAIFGSVLGALLPLGTALVGVVAGLGVLGLGAVALTFGTAAPTLAVMIGLGVGIDYAVFLTTRFRQALLDGVDPVTAAASTTASSGRAVVVAASTVVVAMLGLYASGITFIGQLGLAAAFGVVTSALGAVTLVPAALAATGRRIDALRVHVPVAEAGTNDDGWHRYAASVGRRPWTYLLGGLLVLCVVAIPLLSLSVGHVGDGADPTSFTDRRAYDLVARGFGVGANGPLTVVLDVRRRSRADAAWASTVQARLAATPGVARATPFVATPDHALLVDTVVPTTGPQSSATAALVTHLVAVTLPSAVGPVASPYVTGAVAEQTQFDGIVAGRLGLIMAVVIATAFALVTAAFRSLWLALKAAVLNLFSIAAAYGVVVAVFQWGWARSWLGVGQSVPVEAYVPMMMFAIVFGLSMDYEIFLLSRVQESWRATGDAPHAVASGLARTGRVISGAALIMVSVFLSFVLSPVVVVKQLAVGLAASVLIDATVVRLVLVPAVMHLLGRRAWGMPAWLDRVVPRLDVEGAVPVVAPADE